MSDPRLPIAGSMHSKIPDLYDVVHNGMIIGRDVDPSIRDIILKAAQKLETESEPKDEMPAPPPES